MFEDFIIRGILGGLGVVLVAAPLGCFVVWRRMSYFGAALAHSALLGVALALMLDMDPMLGVVVLAVVMAVVIVAMEERRILAADTLIGILAHSTLALGIVALAFLQNVRIDLMGYLFGDVLAIGNRDLLFVLGVAVGTGIILWFLWRPLLSATVHADIAAVEGVPVMRVRLVFTVLMAAVIAVGMKLVGVLLIVSLMIIPAAAARRFAATPEAMAVGAVLVGAVSVVGGMLASFYLDTPSGPSIVVVATAIFAVSFVLRRSA
ncbi:MAG: hypothetical protein CMM50_00390 [Rhodospirillaceae bacterium]|jgi:zinc transport system permease protein|nr:hypothetical protein [Rhodospirillaceae bacterium]